MRIQLYKLHIGCLGGQVLLILTIRCFWPITLFVFNVQKLGNFVIGQKYLKQLYVQKFIAHSYVHLKKSKKNPDIVLDFFLDICLEFLFHFYYIKKSGFFCPKRKSKNSAQTNPKKISIFFMYQKKSRKNFF